MIKTALRVFSAGLLFSVSENAFAAEKLYVFYPTSVRPHVISEKLQSSMQNVKVYVFGNSSDFLARMSMEPPDAVLTKTAMAQQFEEYIIVLRGARNENTEEGYVLVAISGKASPLKISPESTVGMVDFLGRSGMLHFVSHSFSITPKVKRVTKPEDLIPLLVFEMADCVLVEEILVDFLQKLSSRPLESSPYEISRQGIVALAVLKGKDSSSIVKGLKNLQGETKQLFGIDKWK